MGYGYSVDLREKLIAVWQKRKLNVEELAELFDVGTATVKRWQRLYRETGAVKPKPHGGGRKLVISETQLEIVQQLVQSHPDWTEEEFHAELCNKHDFAVSRSSVGRAIRKLGYSVKKSPLLLPSEIVLPSSSDEKSISDRSPEYPLRVWFLWTKRVQTSR